MEQTSSRRGFGLDGSLLSKVLVWLLIALSVVALVFVGFQAVNNLGAATSVKGKEYQALFLTNGQVYFGKLSQVNGEYVKMSDIYYLQIQQQVQPGQTSTNNNANPNVSLAKLGGELHGPEDTMYVSRQQVLFWENLKNDGKVAKAIADYKNSNK